VSAAKSKGSDWIMAGTGKLQEDQLLTDFLNAAYGLNMKYVPYKGGGKVAKQLAGKHATTLIGDVFHVQTVCRIQEVGQQLIFLQFARASHDPVTAL
jgi:tripartite-type tricarboxylate transporter receptor subunit TctC